MTEKDVTSQQANASVTDDSATKPTDEGSERQASSGELSGDNQVNPGTEGADSSEFNSKGEFINALGEKNKKLKEKDDELTKLQQQLKEYREKERQARLAEMSEAERLKVENNELRQQVFAKEISSFAQSQLSKYGLSDNPIAEIVSTEPWLLPAVKQSLGDSPTWEEVQEAVQAHLPGYLESLSEKAKGGRSAEAVSTNEEQPNVEKDNSIASDAERVAQPSAKRIWKASEISSMSTGDYLKNRQAIHLAAQEGRIR